MFSRIFIWWYYKLATFFESFRRGRSGDHLLKWMNGFWHPELNRNSRKGKSHSVVQYTACPVKPVPGVVSKADWACELTKAIMPRLNGGEKPASVLCPRQFVHNLALYERHSGRMTFLINVPKLFWKVFMASGEKPKRRTHMPVCRVCRVLNRSIRSMKATFTLFTKLC